MAIDVKTLALSNLIVQTLLLGFLSVSVYQSLIIRNYKKHCTIFRIAVPVQILAIALIMLPSLLGYLVNESKGVFFNAEIIVHHTLGLVVVAVWVYCNLVLLKLIKPRIKLKAVMWPAFVCWVLSYLGGVYLYFNIYGW